MLEITIRMRVYREYLFSYQAEDLKMVDPFGRLLWDKGSLITVVVPSEIVQVARISRPFGRIGSLIFSSI